MNFSPLDEMDLPPTDTCLGTAVNGTCVYDEPANSTSPTDVLLSNMTTAAPAATGSYMVHVYINLPLQIFLGFVTIITNLMTLLALSKVRTKFHPHLLLVVNLTISDMMFGVRTVIFRSLWFAFQFNSDLKAWFSPAHEWGCPRGLIRVLGSTMYTCTYINLVAMAFDLYFAIITPFSYAKIMTRRRAIILNILCWVFALLMSGANYVVAFFHYIGKFKEYSYCEIRAMHTMVDIYVYLGLIYIGIILMTYLYTHIFIEVRRCARYTPGMPMKDIQSTKRKKRKVVTTLLVLFTFLIGWLPNGVLSTMYFVRPDLLETSLTYIVGMYFAVLPMLNSICDPIIYAIRLDKVRIGFQRMFGKKRSMFDFAGSEVTEQVSLSLKDNTSRDSKRSYNQDTKRDFLLNNANGNGVHSRG